MRPKSPIADVTRPGKSSRCSCEVSRDSSITRRATTIPRMPIGTLMKKIQLQSMYWVISAADQRADRERHRGGAGPDPDRRPALPRREGGGDDRERGRVHQRRAHSLDDARSDQEVRAGREAAGERGEGEDGEADDEDPPPAEHVGELAARQHQDGERERVAVHDPLELGEADVQVALDRGQRDVHDRVVEHDHEQAERDRRERPPLAVLGSEEPRSHSRKLAEANFGDGGR